MNSLQENKVIGLKEIVIVVLMSALSIGIYLFCAMPFMASPKWSVLGGYSLGALISGPVFVLAITKAPKIGASFLFFAVKGIYAIVMGQIPTGIVYLVGGVLCELVMFGMYKDIKKATVSYCLHSVIFGIGSFTPMFLAADVYAKQMLDAGMDQSVVDAMVYDLIAPSFLAIAGALLIVGSIMGVFIGYKVLKKHFRPAGVA